MLVVMVEEREGNYSAIRTVGWRPQPREFEMHDVESHWQNLQMERLITKVLLLQEEMVAMFVLEMDC